MRRWGRGKNLEVEGWDFGAEAERDDKCDHDG